MSVSVTLDADAAGRDVAGDRFIRRGTVNIGTYATGGVAVTKATFDLWHSLVDLRLDSSAGYLPRYDLANLKIMVYDQKDPAAAGGADIALPEVGNGVDLSAVNFRFRAEGK